MALHWEYQYPMKVYLVVVGLLKIFGCDGVEGDLSDCIASKKSSGNIFLLVINWFKPYEWTTFFWFNFLFIGDIIGNIKLFCDLLSM